MQLPFVPKIFRRGGGGHENERARALCDELRASGSELIDGECSEEMLSRLTAHLNECDDCDTWQDSLRATVELLKTMPQNQVSDDTIEKVKSVTTRQT